MRVQSRQFTASSFGGKDREPTPWSLALRAGKLCWLSGRDKNTRQRKRRGISAKDVFDLIEDGGAALSGLVVHLQCGVELFHEFALLFGQLCGRQHADVIVQVTSSASVRVGQTFALDTENRAALSAFGDLESLLAAEAGNLELCAESSLSHAERNGAVQVSTTALKESVLLHLEDNVQVTSRPAVGPRLAFPLNAQPRAGIDAGRDPQFNGALAIHATLASAFGAALLNDLASALPRGTGGIDCEEALLINKLAAAAASLARNDAGSFLRAGTVAGLTVLLTGDANFRRDAVGCFFEAHCHVITEVRAPLHTIPSATTTGGTEKVLEAEEIPENIVEVLEDGAVKVRRRTGTRQTGVTVGVIYLALLPIAQNAIRFRAFTEANLGLLLALRIAVGVPLQGRLSIGTFDFLDRSRFRDAKYFVIVSLRLSRHDLGDGPFSNG